MSTTNIIDTKALIKAENPELYDFVLGHLSEIPDFGDTSSAQDRWSGLTGETLTWNALYRELSAMGHYEKIALVLNTTRKAALFPIATLREFIQHFPTILWVSLLSGIRGAFRILVAANDLEFIERGLTLLKTVNKESLLARIWPHSVSQGLLAEITTVEVVDKLRRRIGSKLYASVCKWTLSELEEDLARKRPNWPLFRVLIGNHTTSEIVTGTNANWWLNKVVLGDRDDIPQDIIIAYIDKYVLTNGKDILVSSLLRSFAIDSYLQAFEYLSSRVWEDNSADWKGIIITNEAIAQIVMKHNPDKDARSSIAFHWLTTQDILIRDHSHSLINYLVDQLSRDDFLKFLYSLLRNQTATMEEFIASLFKREVIENSLQKMRAKDWDEFLERYLDIKSLKMLQSRANTLAKTGIPIKSLKALSYRYLHTSQIITEQSPEYVLLILPVVDTEDNRRYALRMFKRAVQEDQVLMSLRLAETKLIPRDVLLEFANNLKERTSEQ